MKDFNQNDPHHCYDLLRHNTQAVLAVTPDGLSDDEFISLRLAALFHDIGKTEAAVWENNRMFFYGHAQKSAEIAFDLLTHIGMEETAAKRICFFIKEPLKLICSEVSLYIFFSQNH